AGSQLLDRVECIVVGDHQDFVANRRIKVRGNEAGANSFNLMFPGWAAAKNRALGFDCDRQGPRNPFLHIASYSSKCPRSAHADDNSIDAPLHLLENFRTGSLVMEVGISGILKLCSNERLRIAGREILGALDGALHASLSGVRITCAPRARMMITFSSEYLSGTNSTTL